MPCLKGAEKGQKPSENGYCRKVLSHDGYRVPGALGFLRLVGPARWGGLGLAGSLPLSLYHGDLSCGMDVNFGASANG